MNATRKVKLKDITSNLTCKLCLGYLVDATTIIECLHSFCKSCILKYLEKSADLEEKYCPVCDVQLHSTKPLTSIRPDLMLQEIVYKLVPGLFKDEMSQRRKFYGENRDVAPSNQLDSGQVFDELYITSDDIIHLSLEYVTEDVALRESTRRYLKCPAAVSVYILKKLIQGKYDLDVETEIDVMFGERMLPDDFLLMDVAYKYSWTMNGSKPLALGYRIKGLAKPVIKHERAIRETIPAKTAQDLFKNTAQQEELLAQNMKKVCNENGSNIMPPQEIKTNQIKLPGTGCINGELTIEPIKTLNGKFKNRKRKHLRYSDIVIESKDDIRNLTKRIKQDSTTNSDSLLLSKTDQIPKKDNVTKSGSTDEVQLKISENGVMSARRVSSGDDKIILNLKTPSDSSNNLTPSPTTSPSTNITEKILLSGNFHSKTGPSGVTEIICDQPDSNSNIVKPSSAKPGYVTLNIPNPSNPIMPQINFLKARSNEGNAHDSNDDETTKCINRNSQTKNPKVNSPTKKKLSKASLIEKLKNKLAVKSSDGDSVIQAINDVDKRNNSAASGNSAEGMKLTPQTKPGMHTLPIITPLTNQFLQQLHRHQITNVNGSPKISNSNSNLPLPIGLNFSPASGMSVSMIPCSSSSISPNSLNLNGNLNPATCPSSSSSTQITPPKRISHQTTVVNGNLKFSTSPKFILPKTGDNDLSPKKPPKFFKHRHTASPGSSSSPNVHQNGIQSTHQKQDDVKRKLSSNLGSDPANKRYKERKDSQKSSHSMLFNTSNSPTTVNAGQYSSVGTSTVSSSSQGTLVNGISNSRPLTYPSTSGTDKLSQHLSALNSLAMLSAGDPLNSTFGIAAAAMASSGALGMVPFVTDNYCSMPLPFLNPRQPVPPVQFPFGYPMLSYQNPRAQVSTASQVSPLQTAHKPSTAHSSSMGKPTKNSNDASATLDLSVGKGNNEDATDPRNTIHNSPLLIGLLNSSNLSLTEKDSAYKDSVQTLISGKLGDAKTQRERQQEITSEESKLNGGKEDSNALRDGKKFSDDDTIKSKSQEFNLSERLSGSNKDDNLSHGNKDSFDEEKTNFMVNNNAKTGNTFSGQAEPGKSFLEQPKVLCLSAQNNNDQTMSNNHEKSLEDSSSSILRKTLDRANINGKGNSSPVVADQCSKTGSG